MIAVKDCKEGFLYKLDARNAGYGIFIKNLCSNGFCSEFIISRYKFGENFLFEEIHTEVSDDFGTATPLEELGRAPFTLDQLRDSECSHEILDYLNMFED